MAKLTAQINADASQFLEVIKKVLASAEEAQKAIQQAFGESGSISVDDSAIKSALDNVELLSKEVSSITGEVNVDDSDIDTAKKKIESIDGEAITAKVKTDDSGVDATKKKLNELDGSSVEVEVKTSGLDGLTDAFSGGLLGGLLGGGLAGIAEAGIGAIVGGLGAAYEAGNQFNTALGDLQAKTGATAEEMKKLEQASKDAFLGGVGESVAEATQVIGNAQTLLGDFFNPKELSDFTVGAQAIANTFDLDVNEVITKSSSAIKQFGLTGAEAFDLVAYAMQNGASAQEDVLDSLSEYAQNATDAGFSALEFGEAIARGAKEGVFNTDKIGDSIKEAQIRINAGDFENAFKALTESAKESGAAIDDNVVKAFEEIGNAKGSEKAIADSIQTIIKSAQTGEITVKEAMQKSAKSIQDALDTGQISESFASALQVGIAGTPAEDIGVGLYNKIFSAPFDEKAIAENARKAGESIGGAIGQYTSFDKVQREFELFITTISQGFIAFSDKIIAPIFGGVIEIIGGIKDAFDSVFGDFEGGSGITDFIDGLINAFGILVALVRDRISGVFRAVFGTIKGILEAVGTAISPLVDLFTDLFNNVSEGGGFFEDFGTIMKDVGDIIGLVGGFIFDLLITPLEFLIDIIVDVVSGVGGFISSLFGVSDAGKFFGTILDRLVGALSNIKGTIGGVIAAFKAFKDAIKNLDFSKVVTDLLSGKNPFAGVTDKLSEAYDEGFNKATGKYKNASDDQSEISSELFKKLQADIEALNKRKGELSNQEIANEKRNTPT